MLDRDKVRCGRELSYDATFSTDAVQNCRADDLIEVNYILILRERTRIYTMVDRKTRPFVTFEKAHVWYRHVAFGLFEINPYGKPM